MSDPSDVLSLDLLEGITLTLLRNGSPVASGGQDELLTLDLEPGISPSRTRTTSASR